jgi:light-regulated signal transduction histidine kinase (bacteriophytochrome)
MGRLVNDLLDLAQIGQKQAKPRLVSLDSLIDQVVTNVRAEITDRYIEWRVGSFPAVMCDPGLMHIVFTNLLSNAVKYTRPRQKAVIEIGQMVADGQLVIYVRDNGVGFNMKYADRLFGVFQRLHRAEEFEGAGVGLATVQRIIRKHNGRVWAESAADAGATFFFTLGGNIAAQETNAPI